MRLLGVIRSAGEFDDLHATEYPISLSCVKPDISISVVYPRDVPAVLARLFANGPISLSVLEPEEEDYDGVEHTPA